MFCPEISPGGPRGGRGQRPPLRHAGCGANVAAIMTRFLTPLAARLPSTVPFTGPETLERRRGAPFVARLGANENGFGPSPRAIAAMAKAAADGKTLPHCKHNRANRQADTWPNEELKSS